MLVGVHAGRVEIDELGTVLSIWAHPDDETYLAGAVMAADEAFVEAVRTER